jgi:hypothetical protein
MTTEPVSNMPDTFNLRGVVMPAQATPQRVYPNENGQAVIVCPQCMGRFTINAGTFMQRHKPLKAGCRCGHKFPVVFDTRKFYRKALRLPGQYTKLPADAPELITVEDLSYTGVKFRTRLSHKIEVDDVLTLDFILDNKQRSRIVKTVRVMWVMGPLIGAEFRDRQAYSSELTYYLNAS